MSWWWSTSAFQSRKLLEWFPELSLSIVDDVVRPLVTAFESVTLVSMLLFFFVFCDYTVLTDFLSYSSLQEQLQLRRGWSGETLRGGDADAQTVGKR
ncbi:hypothetical protein ACFX13_024810 [Malus domestica]